MRSFILLIIAAVASATANNFGVDDWDSARIAKFFNKNVRSRTITADMISDVGITPADLFDEAAPYAIAALGVTDPNEVDKVLDALGALDTKISEDPGDFFEWRIANLRLCDLWLTPMAMQAPRMMMLWLRYGNDAGKDAIESVDDAFDEASGPLFWTKFLFFPHFDFFSVARSFDATGDDFFSDWVDNLLHYLFGVKTMLDFVLFLKFLHTGFVGKNSKAAVGYLFHALICEAAATLFVLAGYYIGPS